ncbi:hypothetical protein BGW80DRAFT_1271015 [Lactifluus volemus]|nr:hypothetical protein BGW80DRAFT_1271015 [Lactifluus volemus]
MLTWAAFAKINLGGTTLVSSQTEILHGAKLRRAEREECLRIQSSWRSLQQSRLTKKLLAEILQEDVLGINGMRALVLIGRDDVLLAQWSEAVISAGDSWSLHHISGPNSDSWVILIRKIAILLLRSVANSPQAPASHYHLRVLDKLLSPTSSAQALGPRADDLRMDISSYLLHLELYPLLAEALKNIPVDEKASPSIPLLVSLLTHPFRTFDSSRRDLFYEAYTSFITHVLTLPLLPNRLPLSSLTHFSANIPFSSTAILSPSIPQIASTLGVDAKVHLLANVAAFAPPRYHTLLFESFTALLHLLATVMSTLPARALERKLPTSVGKQVADSESDSDLEDSTNPPFVSRAPLPRLDDRTTKRLLTLPSTAHVSSLIHITKNHTAARIALCDFLLALCSAWPDRVDSILSTVIVSTGGGLVRELYRNSVRSSPLGKEVSLSMLLDFFSGLAGPTRPDAPRNPLTLDEVTSLSRKLLNISFTLFWREGQIGSQDGHVPGLNIGWESVRRKVTRLLQAVHARDSRRPFTPSGHWLVDEFIDIQSFLEAAILEDQQYVYREGSRPITKRSIADLSPRLGVLNNIPFAIPFEARVKIFRSFIRNDKGTAGSRSYSFHSRTRATVRRGHVAEDGFDKLGDANLKEYIEISFIDQFGEKEEGIDGGGLFKEFMTELLKEVFDSDRGLWLANKKNECILAANIHDHEAHSLNWYRFIGRILGKALYEGILVDVAFAGFFLAKWLGKQSFLDDLASLDPDLYQGLIFLKHYPGNPEDLSLNFTIADEEFGIAQTVDLKPNGSSIPVTRDNKLEYIHRVSHYRLTKQIKRQSDAFFQGLSSMIDPKWLRMFNQQELQLLLGGVNTPVDVSDLRRNTVYGGSFDDNEPTIVAFWKVVEGFNAEQRQALLRFVTSVGRPPLLCGLRWPQSQLSIRSAGEDQTRLPTASTCVNLLKLPPLQAIFSGSGFDLS